MISEKNTPLAARYSIYKTYTLKAGGNMFIFLKGQRKLKTDFH